MKYEVPIVYRGQSNFIVEASSAEEAERIARERFELDAPADILGNEWEEVERVGVIKSIDIDINQSI